jgi:hypothetical protein
MIDFCLKKLPDRANAKYDPPNLHKCFKEKRHEGRCAEFPYLDHLKSAAPKVRQKIIRDSTKTTGASWKSDDAGPNRISRWTMLLSDEELADLGINMSLLKDWVVSKLREKAATYDECMDATQKLTWSAYGMLNAPSPNAFTKSYLEALFGPISKGDTVCLVCKAQLNFNDFGLARRGKAEIETAHANPRQHSSENVGFAHRHCNIAQGDKSLPEFYEWMAGVLDRADWKT